MKQYHDQVLDLLAGQYPLELAVGQSASTGQPPFQLARGEICPTQVVPVLVLEDGEGIRAVPMAWGWPKWDGKGVLINARSETALTKPLFRESLLLRPIAVPTTGFFEWQPQPLSKKKRKFIFCEASKGPDGLLYLAGFYNCFEGCSPLPERFVVLTTAANASMVDYHDRMPVLLAEHELEDWFGGNRLEYFLSREPVCLEARCTS